MKAPRQATLFEAGEYRIAIKQRNRSRLREIVCEKPHVMWGSITLDLTAEDLRWTRDAQGDPEDTGGYNGA